MSDYHPSPSDYAVWSTFFLWTAEPPTQEGWYWVDYAGGVAIVEVFSENGECFVTDGYYGDQRKNVKEQDYHTHWLGPLPEPESPTKESEKA
jgi:hypothetical protein